MTRRNLFTGAAAALLLGAVSKKLRREWKPNVARIWVLDREPPNKIVVDPYCSANALVVMGGCIFGATRNMPPWNPDTSLTLRDLTFKAWTIPVPFVGPGIAALLRG